jgi:hypothetical protein
VVYMIPVALLGWIPLSLALFVVLRPQQAVICGIVGAWLLLPPASLAISGLPDYDKSMASTVGICLATLIFQPNRLLGFRPRWFDVAIVAWCACPMISSLENGLGAYDGFSAVLSTIVRWALPYFIGRLYFGTLEELRELSVGVVVGGLIYVLPTLFEMRMSPWLRQSL